MKTKRRKTSAGGNAPSAVQAPVSEGGAEAAPDKALASTFSRLFGGAAADGNGSGLICDASKADLSGNSAAGSFLARAAAAAADPLPPLPRPAATPLASNTGATKAGAAQRHAKASTSSGEGAAGTTERPESPGGPVSKKAGSKLKRPLTAGTAERLEDPVDTVSENAGSKTKRPLTDEEREEREGRTLFVGNVPLSWGKKKLREALRGAVGEHYKGAFSPIWFRGEPLKHKWAGNARLRKAGSIHKEYDETVSDSKHAYVVLDSAADMKFVSFAVNGCKAGDKHVLRADGVGKHARLANFDRKRSIFVGNLPPSTTEADLRAALKCVGVIDAVRVVRDKKLQACKGIAFVRFAERSCVKAALRLWSVQVKGRDARISRIEQQQPLDQGSGPPGPSAAAAKLAGDVVHPALKRMDARQRKHLRHRLASANAEDVGPPSAQGAGARGSGRGGGQGSGGDHARGRGFSTSARGRGRR